VFAHQRHQLVVLAEADALDLLPLHGVDQRLLLTRLNRDCVVVGGNHYLEVVGGERELINGAQPRDALVSLVFVAEVRLQRRFAVKHFDHILVAERNLLEVLGERHLLKRFGGFDAA